MPGGYRWTYHATGLPGWMRFGFSPGWVGRSPTGLGPGAAFLTTGQWPTPQAQAFWQAMQSGRAPCAAFPPLWGGTPGQTASASELELLKTQAEHLGSQLEQIRGRIAELEKAAE